ncbi:HNH endonuclease [Eggerthella guodeyinii]|nr:HNH endonuclease [Eggerthella guodeyinii]
MDRREFKSHQIIRSVPVNKMNYREYRSDLERDFHCRCAYCNLHKESVTTPFEIDHFIPKAAFDGVRDDLATDYSNLVYSCKKCNQAKGAKFEGDINAFEATNERFYDPAKVDYNTVFYRNEYGCISSNDEKGRRMIVDLRLYRPIHVLGWICEQLGHMKDALDRMIEIETNLARKTLLIEARNRMACEYCDKERVFKASYNDPEFCLDEKLL